MIFLSSYQLPLLSALLLLALSPSPVLFLALSLLHGDSDTAEMLHLNDIPDESHTDRPLSDFQCFILFVYFFQAYKHPPVGYNLWTTAQVQSAKTGSCHDGRT